jgi:hypothetical protein
VGQVSANPAAIPEPPYITISGSRKNIRIGFWDLKTDFLKKHEARKEATISFLYIGLISKVIELWRNGYPDPTPK